MMDGYQWHEGRALDVRKPPPRFSRSTTTRWFACTRQPRRGASASCFKKDSRAVSCRNDVVRALGHTSLWLCSSPFSVFGSANRWAICKVKTCTGTRPDSLVSTWQITVFTCSAEWTPRTGRSTSSGWRVARTRRAQHRTDGSAQTCLS